MLQNAINALKKHNNDVLGVRTPKKKKKVVKKRNAVEKSIAAKRAKRKSNK